MVRAGAIVRSRFHYERNPNGFTNQGKQKWSTISRLVVANEGDATAEGLTVSVSKPEGMDEGAGFRWGRSAPDTLFDLLPGAEREWPFLPVGLDSVLIHSEWAEAGKPHSEDQTITV